MKSKSKSKSLSPSGTSLASIESLSMPLVCILSYIHSFVDSIYVYALLLVLICSKQFQEVVLSADVRCTGCQNRLADMMSKMGGKISMQPSFFGSILIAN